jgi:hypothetical protein
MAFNSREDFLKEYARAYRDTPYALKTYLETYDNTQSKYVPLALFPDQETLIKDYDTANENIVIKYRQAGVSTVTAAWAAKKLAFATKKKPEKILIVANKLDTATEFAIKIRNFIQQWPEWLEVEFSKEKDATSHYKLTNGSEVKAVGCTKDALRGYTPTILIFDEAAYIEAGDDFWAACMASLSTGGKVIVISTPNGFDQIYYGIYKQAIDGHNNFKISYLYWYTDPRFVQDLKWVKCDDIIHYMLNRGMYDDDEVCLIENDQDKFTQLMLDGYKPYSPWFEGMCKKLKYDVRKINQEINCAFLGSGSNVFPVEVLEQLKEKHIVEPTRRLVNNMMWIWKPPVPGHKYIMGIDVSSGQSDDYSSFSILDFDEKEQVAEFFGKIPPDELADIAYPYAVQYNAFVVVDITNGWGGQTSKKLYSEYQYKNMFFDKLKNESVWKYDPKKEEKLPGITFNSKRVQIIAALEEDLRSGLIVHSERLYNEFNTFVYINGKPDHMKGHHDDAIMGLAMAVYVGETSFAHLKKVNKMTKAMLESWTMNENKPSTGISTGHPTQTNGYDPFILSPGQMENQAMNPGRHAYQQFGWLFGKPKQ